MRKLRVLVVDDAVVVRRLMTDVLESDPGIEVVGVAVNGRAALAKVAQLHPDVVTLDVEMPEMDGLQALAQIRKLAPKLPIIMFSTSTRRGTSSTIEALTLGADDYVTKPSNVGSVTAAMQEIRAQLIPKIKALCGQGGRPAPPPPPLPRKATPAGGLTLARPAAPPPRPRRSSETVHCVVIGCSTGGPNALASVLPKLPADLPVPILVVQHMPPVFTRLLAERLDSNSAISVREAQVGELLEPGVAYVAPGDQHLRVAPGARPLVGLDRGEPRNSCRPAVDVLFESAAEVYGAGVLGVVLTGMGQDGLRGGERIREAGGEVIAQDEATSVIWGMPGFVVRNGVASEALPLDQIALEIVRRVRRGRRLVKTAEAS